ncbi:C40 family peptidase [Galbibacter sp.]|jgi:cell wall-associated NlpC family hydrolase|uniref:C40 family peptidase n=1 Tax=Galbibacter sp. TaxID=2918471 RepID=UPI003A9272BD
MKNFRLNTAIICVGILTLVGCQNGSDKAKTSEIEELYTAVKTEYAPDSRVAIFDIETTALNNSFVLKGMTNLPKALSTFKNQLADNDITFVDSVQVLPSSKLDGKTQGIIALSAANLRSKPKHSAELVTQGTLGMPVTIYKKQNGWYLIQTPDQYIAWVDSGGVVAMDSNTYTQWTQSDKLIYTQTFGSSFAEKDAAGAVVSDLVAGNVLKLIEDQGDFYQVEFPDKRIAFIPKTQAMPYQDWLASLSQTKQSLVETSKTLMGLPYLWGGTSPKGVDCSGFTKTVFFLNGLIIPRDASQQIHQGILVDQDKDFSKLQPGDLLFFGKKATETSKERIIHVGMWIGNNEFIHSAGSVHISSVDKDAPNYDLYNINRYIRTKRLLNQDTKGIIDLQETKLF